MGRIVLLLICMLCACNRGPVVLEVGASDGTDDTERIQALLAEAARQGGREVIVRFAPGDYHLSRTHGSTFPYHISNTTSAAENPSPDKHIGLWLKNMRNVTLDGSGARFITHGEMTTFVIDSCENITLCNFTLLAADPSLPEITVVERGDDYIVARPSADTRHSLRDGLLYWCGEGWAFTGGIAQVFYPERNVTLRTTSPMEHLMRVEESGDGCLKMYYPHRPAMNPGEVYQMRHSFRTEVCGFINRSRDITLRDINFRYLGNFGIVGQYSENLNYDRIVCAPDPESDRTGVGFADFIQMSGCRGKISITDSYFEGAQDDPINIHGTHLRVVEQLGSRRIKVRFMHGQSYGFEAFTPGDEIEIVDARTLLCMQAATVAAAERIDDYTFALTLDRDIADEVRQSDNAVVENTTWTPEVYIARNYFARIPTRGILITTRRKSVIEDNLFFRLPMSAILVADDARNWYESGPVGDLTIRRNTFVECGSPVISIAPEISRCEGAVHHHITIEENLFRIAEGVAVKARATDGLIVRGNRFDTPLEAAGLIVTDRCGDTIIKDNRAVEQPL